MKYNIIKVYNGDIIHDDNKLSLLQLCNSCSLNPEFIIQMVEEGILEPEGERRTTWRFSYDAVDNIRKVQRFQNDLNVNIAGAALALHLLEKIERLENLLARGR